MGVLSCVVYNVHLTTSLRECYRVPTTPFCNISASVVLLPNGTSYNVAAMLSNIHLKYLVFTLIEATCKRFQFSTFTMSVFDVFCLFHDGLTQICYLLVTLAIHGLSFSLLFSFFLHQRGQLQGQNISKKTSPLLADPQRVTVDRSGVLERGPD